MAHRINKSHCNFDGNFAFKGDGGASFGEDKLRDIGGGVDIGTLDGVLSTATFFFIYGRKHEEISLQHLMMYTQQENTKE